MKLERENFFVWLHVGLGLLLLPGYAALGEPFKFLVAPYVLYMVWSKDARFFPALLIHIVPGTTISALILLSTLAMGLVNYNRLRAIGAWWLYVLALVPLPVFAYMTFMRIVYMGEGFVASITPLFFYLGVFPFFYGLLIAPKIKNSYWRAVLAVLAILPFLDLLPFLNFSVRTTWFSLPLFLALFLSTLFNLYGGILQLREKILSIAFLGLTPIVLPEIKLTIYFSGLFAFAIILLHSFGTRWLVKFFSRKRMVVLFVILVALGISNIDKLRGVGGPNANPFSDVNSFLAFVQYKAIDDRATIWAGGWELMVEKKMMLPPYRVPSYSYVKPNGVLYENVEFGLHNIVLELFRNYGFLVGGWVALLYFYMLIRAGRILFLDRPVNRYVLVMAATVLGTGFVGGMVGQFVLQSTFSFTLLGLAGAVAWHGYRSNSRSIG